MIKMSKEAITIVIIKLVIGLFYFSPRYYRYQYGRQIENMVRINKEEFTKIVNVLIYPNCECSDLWVLSPLQVLAMLSDTFLCGGV